MLLMDLITGGWSGCDGDRKIQQTRLWCEAGCGLRSGLDINQNLSRAVQSRAQNTQNTSNVQDDL